MDEKQVNERTKKPTIRIEDEYLKGSKLGKWCGIVGCPNRPTVTCTCGAQYCSEHATMHKHSVPEEATPDAKLET